MRAIISVVGKDTVGILARVSSLCASCQVNVVDVTQTILQDMFVMIMMIDIREINVDFKDFVDHMGQFGEDNQLKIHVMHEDIFNSMHKI